MITAKRRAARRGVLLLIVLSMLAIFSLVAIAYVVIASSEARIAKSFQRIDRQTFSAGDDLQGGVMQIFRGASHFNSVLAPHSLLEDLYGNDSIRGEVLFYNTLNNTPYYLPPDDPANPYELPFTGAGPLFLYQPADPLFRSNLPQFPANAPPSPYWAGKQLIEFSVIFFPKMLAQFWYEQPTPLVLTAAEVQQWSDAEADEARRRVGCVLTMLDGPAEGHSSRIVGFRQYPRPLPPPFPPGSVAMENRLQVVAFEEAEPSDVGTYARARGGHFVINGTAFSGTGFGLNFDNPTTTANSGDPDPIWLDGQDVGRLGLDNNGVLRLLPGFNGSGLPFALRPNPTAPTNFGAYLDAMGTAQPLSPPRSIREFPLHLQGRDDRPGHWVDLPANGGNSMPSDDVGANEDYDAVDYQNMFLAMIASGASGITGISDGEVPIPSFHRPALINYQFNRLFADLTLAYMDLPVAGRPSWPGGWTAQQRWNAIFDPWNNEPVAGAAARIVEFKRKFILRPLKDDHPDFDGGNPDFDALDLSGNNPGREGLLGRDTDGDLAPDEFFWDVDNDNDGIKDSIWIDLGMPVRTTEDGRKCKPLYAFLCVDLDGRLNLNAHGSAEQLRPQYAPPGANIGNPSDGRIFADTSNPIPNLAGAGVLPNIGLSYGVGFGPAEINLLPLLGNNLGIYQNLLLGNGPVAAHPLDGRYGEGNLRPLLPQLHLPGAGRSLVGNNFFNDFLSANMLFDFPGSYFFPLSYYQAVFNGPERTGSYGTPGDLKGSMVVGLDLNGQPIYRMLRNVPAAIDPLGFVFGWNQLAWDRAAANNPYELNLMRKGAGSQSTPAPEDHPFTVAEWEKIVRPNDADQEGLPDRLTELAGAAIYNRRHELTAESRDLPSPNLAYNRNLRDDFLDENDTVWPHAADLQGYPRPRHISDLLGIAILANEKLGLNNDNATLTPQAIAGRVAALLPAEMLRGVRMDVNRPFGNGRDDDGNRIVDEPAERFVLAANGRLEEVRQSDALGNAVRTPFQYADGTPLTIPFDHDNDGDLDFDDTTTPWTITGFSEHLEADPNSDPYAWNRQLHARHLYVLAMLLVDGGWYPPNGPVPANVDQQEEFRARALAQWAVNVVDFYDRDSIMTPFECDLYPFRNPSGGDPRAANRPLTWTDPDANNTWDVDGRIEPDTGGGPGDTSLDDFNPFRGIVWGCERPELVITETLALHDLRTEDLPVGGGLIGSGDTNGDLDQRYLPEGSLFVELFNPWTSDEARPGEFYFDRVASAWRPGVELDQVTPNGDPVWRMVVVGINPVQLAWDPDDPDPAAVPEIDRSIYFTDPTGTNFQLDPSENQYWSDDPIPPLLPNRYAVVGPGDPQETVAVKTTYVGFRTDQSPIQGTTDTRRIELTPDANYVTPGQVRVFGDGAQDDLDRNGPVLTGTDPPQTRDAIQTPIAVVVDQATYPAAADHPQHRLNVSEPDGASSYPGGFVRDPNGIYTYPAGTEQTSPVDDLNTFQAGMDQTGGTVNDFRRIHLQRLADPTRPYEPARNPYRTIDTAQIDLTVFNGVMTGTTNLPLNSRERGETAFQIDNYSRDLWSEDVPGNVPSYSKYPKSVTNHRYDQTFTHTLGYVNEVFGDPRRGPVDLTAAPPIDYRGAPYFRSANDVDGDSDWADPDPNPAARDKPFSWITWNNRPFASQLELLLVPGARSSQLLRSFAMEPAASAYARGSAQAGAGTGPFPHLSNLMEAEPGPPAEVAAQLHRVLEFLQVPSRFVGTDMQVNPETATPEVSQLVLPPQFQWSHPSHGFHPPFNRVSQYRDPGRVNLNTIFSVSVWDGLANSLWPTPFTNFVWSRQGYGPAFPGVNPLMLDPAIPTRFANPFRSSSGMYMVPTTTLRDAVRMNATGSEINATLLREDPSTADEPLLARGTGPWPTGEFNNPDRNPFFQYQSLERLGNLATTRSNVYAVWVTVGYFEVTPKLPAPVDRNVYLEGYTLGKELGTDTGEVQRHRAFYVFDRSIPVAFERGRDLNVDKAIVLKRFIE